MKTKLNFSNPRTIKNIERAARQNMAAAPEGNIDRSRLSVPGSSNVSGIEIRMLPPLIKNNRTLKIWPFPGRAKLYCITVVISDVANQLLGQMDLNSFARIGNGERLPINKTIFYWEKPDKETSAPNQVHVMSSIIKSKGALRQVGNVLGSLKTDNQYLQLISRLSGLSGNIDAYNMVKEISLQLTQLIGQYLGRIDDKPIGAVVHSFTRLHGDWNELGIRPFHAATDNVDFDFEVVVRDEERYMLQHREILFPENIDVANKVSPEMIPL
jgi:hypothetical protein